MENSYQNLYHFVKQGIENNKNFVASHKSSGNWIYFYKEEFLGSVRSIALWLHSQGFQKGDKIAIHCENSAYWVMIDLAILSIGCVSVPIYTTQPSEQIKYILDHSESKALFVSSPNLSNFYEEVLQKKKDLKIISIFQDMKNIFTYLQDIMRQGAALHHQQPDLFHDLTYLVQSEDLISLTYTSGTTGTPKGVMLTHGNMLHSVSTPMKRCFIHGEFNSQYDVALSFLPFTHIFEHCVIYGYLSLSLPTYILNNVEMLKQVLEDVQPVHFTTVPRVLEKVYKAIYEKVKASRGVSGYLAKKGLEIIENYQLGRKRSLMHKIIDKLVFSKIRQSLGGKLMGVTVGGAALSPKIMHFFNAIGIPTASGYGLSETSPGVTFYLRENLVLGSVGTPLEGVEIKIAEDGEILVKGPNVMLGYYKNQKATKEVLKRKWLHTGDIGHLDEKGFLFITDRKKELLKLSTGKYVAPAPIEDKLITYPAIEQAVLLGNEEKFCSALLVISETYKENAAEDLKELIQNAINDVNRDLAEWEKVKKFNYCFEPMSIETGELTPTMKKKRKIILEKRAGKIQEIYNDD